MASPKISNFASGYVLFKFTRHTRSLCYGSNQVVTLQKWSMQGHWMIERIICCCYGNAAAGKTSVESISHPTMCNLPNTLTECKRWSHLRPLFTTSLTKQFSSSVTHNNEQEKDCIPPGNKANETTPKLDGPTLFECSSPLAVVKWWAAAFSEQGVPEAEVSAEFIVAHVLGFKQLHELTSRVLEGPLTQARLDQINKLCTRRKERVPVQYLVGNWDFRDITLVIRPPVFIPRPETEMLVDIILGHYSDEEELHFLEIGCGSGAIAVSILTEMPLVHMTAVDCSKEAVELTRENAERLGVQDRLTLHCAAITSDPPLCLQGKRGSFDAIISNPPYIPTQDMKDLEPEIKLFEDQQALCGGPDGLDLIKDIFSNARYLLKPGGCIWLETDSQHPEAIRTWLKNNQATGVQFVRTFQDYNYRPRFSQLQLQL